ncbi:MAG: DUF2891 domain-containing protein [Phycisphaerales bacterium]
MHRFQAEDAVDHFVSVVLAHIGKEYPNKLDHVMNGPDDVRPPRDLHPIFFGSFDWHSCVHGYWLMVRALRTQPALAQSREVIELIDSRFTGENVAREIAYLKQPLRATFERPYGWGWLLKLAAELQEPPAGSVQSQAAAALARWSRELSPLADAFAARFVAYLPKATYPVRVGTHQNTAFALALASDYARVAKNPSLASAISQRAKLWYAEDRNYPAWEPDGIDFLSPCLIEAECMRRLLPRDSFVTWFDSFLPEIAQERPATLFKPAFVSDRTDGQITHLDGLNLSRAWCWRTIASALPAGDPRREKFEQASRAHLEAALPHVTGDYMGEHWLATFAMLALTEPGTDDATK